MMLSFSQFITEKRRNPDLNPKIGIVDALEPYKDRKNAFISFRDINKIGINPSSKFKTPNGIYAYPLREIWDDLVSGSIPYASQRPYVYLVEYKNQRNIVEIDEYTRNDYNRDMKKLTKDAQKYVVPSTHQIIEAIGTQKVFNKIVDTIEKIDGWEDKKKMKDIIMRTVIKSLKKSGHSLRNERIKIENWSVIKSLKKSDHWSVIKSLKKSDHSLRNERIKIENWFNKEFKKVQHVVYKNIMDAIIDAGENISTHNTPSSFLWHVTRNLAYETSSRGKEAQTWNNILRSLGHNGIIDRHGNGLIHRNEPTQAVFLTKAAIKIIGAFDNIRPKQIKIIKNPTAFLVQGPPYVKRSVLENITNPQFNEKHVMNPNKLNFVKGKFIKVIIKTNDMRKYLRKTATKNELFDLILTVSDAGSSMIDNLLFNFIAKDNPKDMKMWEKLVWVYGHQSVRGFARITYALTRQKTGEDRPIDAVDFSYFNNIYREYPVVKKAFKTKDDFYRFVLEIYKKD